jgi:hypothetical protein
MRYTICFILQKIRKFIIVMLYHYESFDILNKNLPHLLRDAI